MTVQVYATFSTILFHRHLNKPNLMTFSDFRNEIQGLLWA